MLWTSFRKFPVSYAAKNCFIRLIEVESCDQLSCAWGYTRNLKKLYNYLTGLFHECSYYFSVIYKIYRII